ncbi:hybrid sensor histidine kinase/response regulator [Clostridium sp. chh4-2]|uniref:hybrid sensor histidine kinase/response regulator n=1 Tax=Clostridium sp. chh4-2 TaxID=2067550 RepID=UPI000CCF4F16|nr:ATP-binding protein [Clostridium sp. chh4-2]PNV62781.1 hybrid sensor histidine kinase/response regulator [Clostridium sp. chh4-2]
MTQKKKEKSSSNNKYKHVRNVIVIGALLAISGIIFLMTMLLKNMEDNARKENEYHLLEIAHQVSDNINSKLEQNWSLLRTIDYELGSSHMSDADIQKYLQNLVNEWKFSHIYLIDDAGNCRDEYGEKSRLITRDHAIALLRDRTEVSFLRRDVNGNATLFFAIPVDEKEADSDNISAIALEYKLDNILDILTISAFEKKGMCYVIDQNGSRLFNTQSDNAIKDYNILNYLEYASKDGRQSAEVIQEAMDGGFSGVTVYTKDGHQEYIGYNPLKNGKWTLLLFVGGDIIGENMNRFSRNVFTSCAAIIGLLIIISGFIFFRLNQTANRKRDADVYNRERMLNLLIDRGNEVYMMYNKTKGCLEYVSPNLESVMGWSRQEAEQLFAEGDTVSEEDIAGIRDEFIDWDGRGEFVGSIHRHRIRNTGNLRWIRLQVNPVHLSSEEVWIANLSDMTKEWEQRENLEQALIAANSANIAKSNFLSNMSHDIRTPMNAILGMAAIAERYAKDPEKVTSCMKKISYSSKHLLSLIDEILDMSRIESGKVLLDNKAFSISDMLDGIVSMFQEQFKSKKLSFNMEKRGIKNEILIGDEFRLSRILVNILSNAVKYTPEQGQILFSITELETDKEGFARYQFVIKDNGRGMTEEFLKTIFMPFTRMEEKEGCYTQGTGLGMAIAKSMLDLMGGTITVESALDKGSTFTVDVEFELAEGWESQEDKNEQEDNKKKRFDFTGKRVLIVEDNEINEEILEELLHMEGALTESAGNGQEAVDKWEESSPEYYDLILMDVQMPVMNGYEAAAVIRSQDRPDAKTIPIIALTANAFSEDRNRALAAGMNAHVTKPIDMTKLYDVLGEVFSVT